MLQEVKPNLIIEVGVWKGQSASHFAGKMTCHFADFVFHKSSTLRSSVSGTYQDG